MAERRVSSTGPDKSTEREMGYNKRQTSIDHTSEGVIEQCGLASLPLCTEKGGKSYNGFRENHIRGSGYSSRMHFVYIVRVYIHTSLIFT